MTLTELAIKRPTLIIVIFAFLGVLGVFGFSQLKYDLMPKMTAPIITVTTIYPGSSPYEVETSITKNIEDAVSGVDKVSSVQSTSSEGRSMLLIEFDNAVNVDLALQDVQRKVNEAAQKLPNDAKKPVVSKIAFDEIPVLRMAVRGNMAPREFYQFIKDRVQPRLSKIAGVGIIGMNGGVEREIKVSLDMEKIKSYGLSLFQVAQVVKNANLDFPTGNIKEKEEQYVVRIAGKFQQVDQIKNLIVGRSKMGGEVRLYNVAEVKDGAVEVKNIYRLNGMDAVGLTVQKQNDANTVEVSKKVRAELKNLEKDYEKMALKFDIAQDGSVFIMDSADGVKEDLLLAVLLVAFIMMIFLHSLRNSIIVMVAIPSSLVSTFFLMYVFGFSLNLMTLLAMSLVIGILVDDSIVVLENIYRRMELGEKRRTAALTGRNEIGFSALSITFVDVVVFVPLAMINGIIGSFLREYALVVVFSTLMSLFVSFTVTPMLASRFSKLEHLTKDTFMGRFGTWFEAFFDKITSYYGRTLKWSLKHGWAIAIVSLVAFVSSLAIMGMGYIGFEFIPVVDRGELILTIEGDPGAKIEQMNYIVQDIEKKLSKLPEVNKVLSNVGSSAEGMLGVFSNNTAELYITLVDKNKRTLSTDAIGQQIKKIAHESPGVKVRMNPVSLMGTQSRSPIQILITGPSNPDVQVAAKQIQEVVWSCEGSSDVRLSSEDGKPEIRVDIDRDKLAQFGLSVGEVGQNLRVALTGDEDSKYRDTKDQAEYIIRVNLDQYDRTKLETVENLSFMNSKGQAIQLKQFASIYQTIGPTKLERYDRISAITVFSQVYGKTSGALKNEIDEKMKIAKSKLPSGVEFKFIGEQKNMAESMFSMIAALFAGILLVYMIMIALYDSFVYPFVVLFSIPLALIGAFYGLAVTGKSLSIYSMLGIIMLVGLVAKNAILLVDRTNQMKRERGMSAFDALMEAGSTRLRPIMMTTFAMIIGMAPIAMATSAGSETKSGLAVTIIGGLTSSMFLTLVLVPVVYLTMDKMRDWFLGKRDSRRKQIGLTNEDFAD